jgi:hypothetical protein
MNAALSALAAGLAAQQAQETATKSGVSVAESEAETQAMENAMGMVSDKAPTSPSNSASPSNSTTSPATMDSSTTKEADNTPDGPDPGMDNTGGSGSGDKTHNPVAAAAEAAVTPDTSVKYDVSKFLGSVGKTTYTTPASVYTSYPIQQGIGAINPNAPKYTGSFYDPSFGKVLYQ